jgi:hypothetical protein
VQIILIAILSPVTSWLPTTKDLFRSEANPCGLWWWRKWHGTGFSPSNVTIRQQIGLEETITKEVEQNQLTWYGHVQRMAEGRLPRIALKWMPKQKRARGRPKKNWMEGIRETMNERNLNEGQWEDRKQWSLGVGQRRKTF